MTDLQKIAANNSADPVLANFEGAVRDGLRVKHTPGPWRYNWVIRGGTPIIGHRDNGESIPGIARVVCIIPEPCRDAEGLANSHLIAAAPDLLDALIEARELIALCQRDGCPAGPVAVPSKIHDAIAKAEAR